MGDRAESQSKDRLCPEPDGSVLLHPWPVLLSLTSSARIWAVPSGTSRVHTSMTLAAPSVMASGLLKPPEKLENKYSLTAWYRRLGEGETEGKQTGYTAVQQQEDKIARLGREEKIQLEQVRIRPLISERAKAVPARRREVEKQSFSVPVGLPAPGQLVQLLTTRNVGLSPWSGIQKTCK